MRSERNLGRSERKLQQIGRGRVAKNVNLSLVAGRPHKKHQNKIETAKKYYKKISIFGGTEMRRADLRSRRGLVRLNRADLNSNFSLGRF